ncbi:DNA-directed RNA polymerase ii subunit rpb9 [Anaeramoeba flamelloides]|uniref:DNA-directed RNA polymerase ii subunit rpb9 n=2 Tax=Anaeramoeba flamelloides TaxID=1746091 RepID=A0AAV8AL97_9EUKA|nr:DNA-directed RNA polymerase ii subunit rpb9 [Anaeramoeba flamelloides]
MEFCPECSNMLYPYENRQQKKLWLCCRNCEFSKQSQTSRVYFNLITGSLEENKAPHNVTTDPTLPRTKDMECPQCHSKVSVFFQAPSNKGKETMGLHFQCIKCHMTFF